MCRRFSVWCCALTLVLSAGCVPPEVDDDSIPRFDPQETLAGQIQRDGTLVIGVEEDFPPFASSAAGQPEGFTVELGHWLADGLGVEAEFVTGATDELPEMVSNGDVEVAFPMVPITEAALDDHFFSDPYFEAHQRVLAPAASGISGIGDLADTTVCSLVDETGVELDAVGPEIEVVAGSEPGVCLDMVRAGEADAITASEIVLISLAARSTEEMQIVGDDLSTAGYGAMIRRNPLGLNAYIDSVFAEAESEGRWEDLYAEWIAPHAGDAGAEPPVLTLETAAAINPRP